MTTTPKQLVYFRPPTEPGKPRSPWLFGEMAQFDECDEDVEDGCVPVRWRGRVMSIPCTFVRPVT